MEAVVPERKIVNYLLVDPPKSQFFRMFGYSEENWQQLQADLISVAENNPKTLRQTTIYGEEYEIVGRIVAPSGREIVIQSGWIIDHGTPDILRFVTAYPE